MFELIGNIAAVLTTAAFFPQVIRTWKTKSTDDMSWSWLLMLTIGVFLWLIYGISNSLLPVTAANGVTFLCLAVLVYIKTSNFLARR